ncbi:PREDICTED: 3-hydroxyisobutyryl-CoA hydrolase 1-like isoform X1 [Nelumbo nucifera]|uniref:3-hydroxyisobutyryl-CoA hydrolase n=1 Tax=Nelumbo nucifera TaxID=4432 RepID=A0A1U8AQ84_NELNU|nr:PREDICTED: 3-hydroxyisobutyryl-CoA hydrolase 1-like isoform X1 [Nelumbo nucifera]
MAVQSVSGNTDQVLVEEHSCVRTIILNRPRQLNALSFQMVSQLLELFITYEEDSNVKLVILKVVKFLQYYITMLSAWKFKHLHGLCFQGEGRAFCAGGDVAAVARDINEGNWKLGAKFFWNEFTLNYIMATYRKAQVSILNGIVFGGGAGASIHGRFRVATENSVFAMPETALGLFPDVGASYFLSRLPGFFGEYVGLTGARLDGVEMLACGLATHFVSAMRLPLLEEALFKVNTSDPAVVSAIISEFSEQSSLKATSSYHRQDIIERCFSRRTVEEILSALEEEAATGADKWLSETIQSLKKASPTSLKISLRSIREGRLQGVGQCLIREYRICCHVLRRDVSKDFFEGCRAILLDKDKNPKWEPSRLEFISDDMVNQYFSKVEDEEWEDLKLPARFNLPASAMAKL